MPLLYYKDNKTPPREFTDKITIGSSARADLRLESQHVDSLHLEIERRGAEYWIANIGERKVVANGKELFRRTESLLPAKAVIWFGKGSDSQLLVLYNNPDIEERVETGSYQKIEQKSADDSIRMEMERLFYEFYDKFRFDTFPDYLVKFLRTHFEINTAAIYKKDGQGKWSGVKSQEGEAHKPSISYFKKMLQEGVAVQFSFTDQDADLALSIVEAKVRRVFYYPLKHQGQIWGCLYCDSKNTHLSDRDFVKISRLLEGGISQFIYLFYNRDKDTAPKLQSTVNPAMFYKIDPGKIVPKNWHIELGRKTVDPIISYKYEAFSGNSRIAYCLAQSAAPEIRLAIKAYLEGLQQNNFTIKQFYNPLQEFLKLIFGTVNVSMADMSITFDGPDNFSSKDTDFEELKLANHEDSVTVHWSGSLFVYVRVSDKLVELDRPLEGVEFKIDDFLVVSPFPIGDKTTLLRGNLSEIRDMAKDFLFLRRDE